MLPTEPAHERMALLRGLRAGTIRSNVPPLTVLHAGLYALAERLAVRWLRRRFDSDLAAIYLRGSAVVDFRVPGLSDIDLTIVLRDEVEPERHRQVVQAWGRLARRLPVLENQPWTMRIEEFRRLAAENPGLRYRVMEAQRAWVLLHGDDVLAGLDDFTPAQRLQALVDDLETRLTYLNGLLFVSRPDDALQRRRTEYLLYKLVLDLARILSNEAHAPLLSRGEVRRQYLDGRLAMEETLGCGSDDDLRRFVAFVARHRLRRCWLTDDARTALARLLLDRTVRTLALCYRQRGLAGLPGVAEQHEHFYAGERFLPTGDLVRRITELPEDFEALRREVRDRRLEGTHVLLETRGLRINLANTDAALGNCTVVMLPADRSRQ